MLIYGLLFYGISTLSPSAGPVQDAHEPAPIGCVWPRSFVDSEAVVRDSALFDRVSPLLSIPDIVEILGPAKVGMHLTAEWRFEWTAVDGETLTVISDTDCGPVLGVSWHRTAPQNETTCTWPQPYLDPQAPMLDSAQFSRVSPAMTVPEIIGILGPARKDVGAGVHALIWEAADGAKLRVSSADGCGGFTSMGVEKPPPDDMNAVR